MSNGERDLPPVAPPPVFACTPSRGRPWRWRRAGASAALLVAAVGCVALAPALAAPDPRVIRFAPERDYGPFVYEDSTGRIEGLSIDILRLVQERAQLRLQMLPARPLAEQLAAVRRGEVDLLSSLRPTPERGEFLRFSKPYVTVPALLVCAGDACAATGGRMVGLAGLAGQPVAVGAGYAVEPVMRAHHPAVAWQAVSDDVVALKGVVEGRFRGAVVDAASFAFVARQHRLRGLQAVERVGFDYGLSFAVPHGREDLIARLDKAIATLPAKEREAAIARWMTDFRGTAPPRAPQTTWFAAALLLTAAVIAGVIGWRRTRRRRA